MKILVTGATGFLGASVVRALLADKNVVRVIIRKSSDLSNIEGLNVEKVLADLEDENSLQLALDGCQALFHVAADYKLWVPNPEAMYRTNVLGTKKLMSAALKARVSRIVYTSSVAVLGKCNGNQNADEDTPVQFKDMIGHYKKSKFLAEEEVKKMVKDDGLPAIIVNPSTPVGVRDIKPTPTGKIIVDFLNGKMPAYVDTGLNIVHVEDCAIGHLLAFKLGYPIAPASPSSTGSSAFFALALAGHALEAGVRTIGIRQRTNNRILICHSSQTGKKLADFHTWHIGFDGPKLASNLLGCLRFKIKEIQVRRTAR